MEWCAFVLKGKTKPGILFTDNGDLFTIRLARSGIALHWSLGRQPRGSIRSMWGNHDSGLGEIFACGLIPESRKFCYWIQNPWALDSGMQFRESRIPFRIEIRTAVPGIRNARHMESKIQDCLGFHRAKVSRVSGFPWMDSSDRNILKLKLVQWDIW